jgi:hypothetical protein
MDCGDDTMSGPALVDGLRAWATGSHCAEAAVDLLVEHASWLSRPEFRRRAVWTDPVEEDRDDGAPCVVGIDWDAAACVLESVPAAASERRVLALAIGLADGDAHPVDLGDALCGLDQTNTALALRAVAHAAGLHERNVQILVNGAVVQVASM